VAVQLETVVGANSGRDLHTVRWPTEVVARARAIHNGYVNTVCYIVIGKVRHLIQPHATLTKQFSTHEKQFTFYFFNKMCRVASMLA